MSENNNNSDRFTPAHRDREQSPLAHRREGVNDGVTPVYASGLPSTAYDALEELLQPRGPSLKDFLTLLKKRKKAILLTAGSIFTVGTLYALLSPSQFTATATLEIRGYSPVLGHAEVETLLENDTRKLLYQSTTTSKLTNLSLADEVLQTDNFAEDLKKYFKGQQSAISAAVDRVLRSFFGTTPEGPADSKFHFSETFMNKYYKLIQISPIHDTSLVEVRATTTDKLLSQRIANAHAEGLIRLLLSEQRAELGSHLAALKTHADELQAKLSQAEADVGKFAQDHQLVTFTDAAQGNLMFSHLTDLNKLLSAAQAKRVESESKMSQVEEQKKVENSLLDDETVKDLRTKLKDAESEYAALSKLVTGEYPKLVELRGKIESLRHTVQDERAGNLSALKTQYKSDLAAEQLLVSQFEEQLKKSHEVSTQLVQFNLLQREAASLRDLTQSVLKSLNETEISTASSMSNVFVSDYAAIPRLPAAPRRGLLIVLSFMLGSIAGIALAVVRELVDGTIKVSDEAQVALGIPTLGIIPSFRAMGAKNLIESEQSRWAKMTARLPWRSRPQPAGNLPMLPSDPGDDAADEQIIVDPQAAAALPGAGEISEDAISESASADGFDEHGKVRYVPADQDESALNAAAVVPAASAEALAMPESAVLDALRTLRVNILFSSTQNVSRVIMAASAREREGKTSVIANLAITFARAGQRTLLVDGDLRRPKISKRFGVPNDHSGLVDFLAGQATIEDIIFHSPVANLFVLPAGSPTVDPTELLGSQRMGQMIATLRDCFDVILIDAAPVLPVADSLMLAQYAETVIFVVRSGKTEKSAAQEAVRRLRRVGARVRGLVLNDFDPGESSYSPDRYSLSKYKPTVETRAPISVQGVVPGFDPGRFPSKEDRQANG